MTQFDSDCNGKISLVEFQKAVEKLKELEAAVWWSFANIFEEAGYFRFLIPNFMMAPIMKLHYEMYRKLAMSWNIENCSFVRL